MNITKSIQISQVKAVYGLDKTKKSKYLKTVEIRIPTPKKLNVLIEEFYKSKRTISNY